MSSDSVSSESYLPLHSLRQLQRWGMSEASDSESSAVESVCYIELESEGSGENQAAEAPSVSSGGIANQSELDKVKRLNKKIMHLCLQNQRLKR